MRGILLWTIGHTSCAITTGFVGSNVLVHMRDFWHPGKYLNCGHRVARRVIFFNSDSRSTICTSIGRQKLSLLYMHFEQFSNFPPYICHSSGDVLSYKSFWYAHLSYRWRLKDPLVPKPPIFVVLIYYIIWMI